MPVCPSLFGLAVQIVLRAVLIKFPNANGEFIEKSSRQKGRLATATAMATAIISPFGAALFAFARAAYGCSIECLWFGVIEWLKILEMATS